MGITTIEYETDRRFRCRFRSLTSCATVALLGGLVAAQEFEINRWTIDGGGTVQSTGGDFELSSTIGQPDGGSMSGESFELTGGFWFETPPTDCNDDGLISLLDNKDFVLCMTGPATAASVACRCFDVDVTGRVDLADFAFVQAGLHGN